MTTGRRRRTGPCRMPGETPPRAPGFTEPFALSGRHSLRAAEPGPERVDDARWPRVGRVAWKSRMHRGAFRNYAPSFQAASMTWPPSLAGYATPAGPRLAAAERPYKLPYILASAGVRCGRRGASAATLASSFPCSLGKSTAASGSSNMDPTPPHPSPISDGGVEGEVAGGRPPGRAVEVAPGRPGRVGRPPHRRRVGVPRPDEPAPHEFGPGATGQADDTLVVFTGEFGRTPMAQGSGRDHHIKGFSLWMAGGGVKGGVSYGATDDLGYNAVEDVVHVRDLHATMLHVLGVDHRRLTYQFQGLDFRLTGVEEAHVVKGILA